MSRGVLIAPPRYAPQIELDPSGEREGREHINFLLRLACLSVHRFGTAVRLIQHCQPLIGPKLGFDPAEWMGIAVRDAALSVYHFGSALEAIRRGLKTCPELRAQADMEKVRDAGRSFARDFPDAAALRHAVGHMADQLSTPEKLAELRRPGEFLMWETQVGEVFTMASRTGKQVRLDVDDRTQDQLQTILTQVCEAFAGANATWAHACG